MVRLRDIALKLGISESLVSKVLSGKLGSTSVTAERAALIRSTATAMGYIPNLNARSLAGKPSQMIGILIDSNAPAVVFRVLAGIEREASVHGYRCLIGEAHNSLENLRASVAVFLQYGVDGIISLAHEYPGKKTEFARLFADLLPRMVFIGKAAHKKAICLNIDYASPIRQAVRHLYERGSKRIALIRGKSNWDSQLQRQEGYCAEMQALGFSEKQLHIQVYNDKILALNHASDAFEGEIVHYVLENRIDAVVGLNDFLAHRLIFELSKRNIRCPEDIRIVGGDNEPFSPFTIPPLSSIDSKTDEQAKSAFELLLTQLNSPDTVNTLSKTITTELIIREST